MALATSGLRFRETMAGYMSPAGSFRAGYRWGKAAGGDVRFTATIAIPDLDGFLQDPEHCAPLTARSSPNFAVSSRCLRFVISVPYLPG